MNALIQKLGLNGLDDYATVLPLSVFKDISIDTVQDALDDEEMRSENLVDTEESKFEFINRILMMKYGKLIDSIKQVDNNGVGYRLEPMP